MKWFNNLSITQKMIALVGCLLALTLMVSTYSITKMKRVAVEIEAIAHDNLPLAKLMTDMTVHQLEGRLLLNESSAQQASKVVKASSSKISIKHSSWS